MNQFRLRQLGDDLIIDTVYGNRCLVITVKPKTELDKYEALGLAVVNKEEHTPRPSTGIIIQTGNQWSDPTTKIGDMVMFSRYGGADFKIGDNEYRVLDFVEIFCKVIPKDDILLEMTDGTQ